MQQLMVPTMTSCGLYGHSVAVERNEAWALFHQKRHPGKEQPVETSVFPSIEGLTKPGLPTLTVRVKSHGNNNYDGRPFNGICTVLYIKSLHAFIPLNCLLTAPM